MGIGSRSWSGFFAVLVITSLVVTASLAATSRAFASATPTGRHNTPAQPWFWQACADQGANSAACTRLAVEAIDNARATEHLRHRALVLPDNFSSLTPAQQTFVVIDLERVDRGLRPIAGLVPQLDSDARTAAEVQDDPAPATSQLQGLGVRSYHTLWASASGALSSDYAWMYDDGYSASNDSNVDCPAPGAAGCWGHRRAILASFGSEGLLLAGTAAAAKPGGVDSITAILTGGTGRSPHFAYTWADALRHGADSTGSVVLTPTQG